MDGRGLAPAPSPAQPSTLIARTHVARPLSGWPGWPRGRWHWRGAGLGSGGELVVDRWEQLGSGTCLSVCTSSCVQLRPKLVARASVLAYGGLARSFLAGFEPLRSAPLRSSAAIRQRSGVTRRHRTVQDAPADESLYVFLSACKIFRCSSHHVSPRRICGMLPNTWRPLESRSMNAYGMV